MAHFYGVVKGSRSAASRCGTKNTGVSGHIRGWEVGARVEMRHNEETGQDECYVYKTGGSHGATHEKLVAKFKSKRRKVARRRK